MMITEEALAAAERQVENAEARHDFRRFVEIMFQEVYGEPYILAQWQRILLDRLTLAGSQIRSRIMVFVPPQHGKSLILSRMYPAWRLGRDGSKRIILGSYAASLSSLFHRDVKRIMSHPRYAEIFPTTRFSVVGQDTGYTNTNDFSEVVGNTGYLRSMGVDGSVTGMSADILLADDLYKGRSDAESEAMRTRVIDWFHNDFMTRRSRDASVFITFTRWHVEDIAGVLLDKEPEKWEVIRFPLLFDGGEYTHPEDTRQPDESLDPVRRFSSAECAEIRDSLPARDWASVWQQQPSVAGGNLFKEHWLRYWQFLPAKFDDLLTSWDLPFKKKEKSDFAVGQLWGRKGADLYLIAQVRGRMDYPEVRAAFRQFAAQSQAKQHLIEDKANGPALIADLKHEVPGIIAVEPLGDKVQRAQYVLPAFEAGNVYIPEQAPWLGDFLKELASFPACTHDDQVDAMTQAIARLLMSTRSFAGYAALVKNPLLLR